MGCLHYYFLNTKHCTVPFSSLKMIIQDYNVQISEKKKCLKDMSVYENSL